MGSPRYQKGTKGIIKEDAGDLPLPANRGTWRPFTHPRVGFIYLLARLPYGRPMIDDGRDRVLYLVFQGLKVKPSVSSFDDRKRMQKLVYIVQRAGLSLNFRYNWYLQGPYSPELSPYCYEIASRLPKYEGEMKGARLNTQAEAVLQKVSTALGKCVTDTDVLEGVASMLYRGESKASAALRAEKPRVTEPAWQLAERCLRSLKEL